MQRRSFMESFGASAVLLAWAPRARSSERPGQTTEPGWRTFEVATRLDIIGPSGTTRAWVPLPLTADTDYQKRLGDTWKGNAADPRIWRDGKYGAAVLCAEWPAGETAPVLEVVSRFSTRDRAVDLSGTWVGSAPTSTPCSWVSRARRACPPARSMASAWPSRGSSRAWAALAT